MSLSLSGKRNEREDGREKEEGGGQSSPISVSFFLSVLCREIKKEKVEMQRKGYEPVVSIHQDVVVGDRVSTEWVGADA